MNLQPVNSYVQGEQLQKPEVQNKLFLVAITIRNRLFKNQIDITYKHKYLVICLYCEIRIVFV